MEILKPYASYLILALLLITGVQFMMLLSLSGRVASVRRMVRSLLTGPNGEDLEALLRGCRDQSAQSLERADELEARLAALADTMRGCVQHVGLVRFDAYGDVTGKQSFSLALLDAYQDGAIITGLFGRADGRCYGKAVQSGQVETALSDEEAQALEMALSGGLRAAPDGAPKSALNGRRRGRASA